MLRILIADDEINIGKLIRNLIDWEALQLELIAISVNSEETWRLIEKEKPDIVITDIRMPGMTGLELIKKTIDNHYDTRFIVISGYTLFDYARTAIQYGVEDFLLKPINQEELQESLKRLIGKIHASRNRTEQVRQIQSECDQSHLKVRKSAITSLYQGTSPSGATLQSFNEEYYFAFRPGIFQGGILHLDHPNVSQEYVDNMIRQLSRLFSQELGGKCHDLEVCELQQQLLFVLNYQEDAKQAVYDSFDKCLEKLQGIVNPHSLLKLTLCVGVPSKHILDLSGSLFSAECAVNSRLVMGTGQVILAEELDLRPKEWENIPFQAFYGKLRPMLEVWDFRTAMSAIEIFLETNKQQIQQYPYAVSDRIKSMAKAIVGLLRELHPQLSYEETILQQSAILTETLNRCSDYDTLISTFLRGLSDLFSLLHNRESSEDIRKLKIAKEFMEAHFSEHLQLEDVAAQVYLSPAYFGIFFKRETGVNFGDYLIRLRMDHAKTMLKNMQYQIADVAQAVGYKDTRYFSKLFQKHTGVRPSEYRKIYH